MESTQIALVKFGEAKEAFKLDSFQLPKPGNHEALIECEASGLNFADVMARRGLYAPVKKLPFILGYDVVGKVVEVGNEADSNLVGKRVVSLARFGGYRKHLNLPAQALIPLPEEVDFSEGINFSTAFLTAWLMSKEYAGIAAGKTALVYSAAGGVGYFLNHFLSEMGVKTQAVVGNAGKKELLTTAGVSNPIILNSELEKSKQKYDLIFNARGGKTVKEDLKRLNKGGKLVLFGAADQLNNSGIIGKLKLLFGFGFHSPIKLIVNSNSICGFNLLSLSSERSEMVVKEHHKAVSAFLNSGVKPLQSTGFSPEEAAQAHELLESGQSTGKIFIDWTKH